MAGTTLLLDQRPIAHTIATTAGAIQVISECLARVQSISTPGKKYIITHEGETWACECDHFLQVGRQCQHIMGVRYFLQAERPDGTVERVGMTKPQAMNAYDAAQTNEVRLFDALLADLVDGMEEPDQHMGRPRIPLRDAIFCGVQKVYSQLSGRRAVSLFGNATERGQLSQAPSFVISSRFLNRSDATPILHDLIERSAKPLAAVEDTIAIDSTGFRTTSFGAYCGEKHGEKKQNVWLKAHLSVGTKTHIVAKVAITDANGADSPQFAGLVQGTAKAGFRIAEVSADKAYSSRANHDAVAAVGGVALIPFKSNATGKRGGSFLWTKAFHYFQLHREEFDARYHKRSNVESVNSAIKRKFGETLRSRNRVAQENELLCKILAYNLTVLIHEAHESGLDLNALKQKSPGCAQSPASGGL